MSKIIENIRSFILECPFLQDYRVNVDYLGENMEYSIDPLPCDPIIQKYVDGGAKKQFQFAFTSRERYDQDTRINIEKSFAGELPLLEKGKSPVKIETLNSGYLYDVDGDNARYRIECRLIYIQEV